MYINGSAFIGKDLCKIKFCIILCQAWQTLRANPKPLFVLLQQEEIVMSRITGLGESQAYAVEVITAAIRKVEDQIGRYGYILHLNLEYAKRIEKLEINFKGRAATRSWMQGNEFKAVNFEGHVFSHRDDENSSWHSDDLAGILVFNGLEYHFWATYETGSLQVEAEWEPSHREAFDRVKPINLDQLKRSLNTRVRLELEDGRTLEGRVNHIFDDSIIFDYGIADTVKFCLIKKAWKI